MIAARLLVVLVLLAAPLAAEAQQAGKVYRIGFLGNSTAALEGNLVGPFREGLRDLGYIEGRNILIEYRWADGKYERFPALIAELAALKVDVIVTAGTPAALAVKKTTPSIPLVMAAVGDPIGVGLVASLARPGGNVTGLSAIAPELEGKRLELLREVVPKLSHIAVLWNPDNPFQAGSLKETRDCRSGVGNQGAAPWGTSLGRVPRRIRGHSQRAAGRAPRPGGSDLPAQPRAHRGLRGHTPPTRSVCVPGARRGGRLDVLWAELRGHAQAGRLLRGQDPQGRQARRPARGATHQVRAASSTSRPPRHSA